MQKYWYVQHYEFCPVCDHEHKWRERVYEKPESYYHVYQQYDYCMEF